MSLTPGTPPKPPQLLCPVQGEVSPTLFLTATSPQVGESLPGLSLHPQGGLSTCPALGRVVQEGWVGQKVPTLQK